MLNLSTNYPGRHTSPSTEYPFGSARDVVTSGDGTGTPWHAQLANDWLGYDQAMLNRAGINPSGTSDNVLVSQRLNAASTIHGRQSESLQAVLVGDFTAAESLHVSGYAGPGDGGEALYLGTGVVSALDAGTITDAGLVYDAAGNEFRPFGNVRNVRQYGALGDGLTDDVDAVLRSVASLSGPGVVYFDAGTFLCSQQVTLPDGVVLKGLSQDESVLSFEGASPGAFPSFYCVFAEGEMRPLPPLASDVVASESAYLFQSAHGLNVDDVFVILDPTASSFSPAQLFYRAGEYVRVATEDGATAATGGSGAFASYDSLTVSTGQLFGVRVSVQDLHVRGLGVTETVGCIGVQYGREVSFRRLKLSGSQADASLNLQSCYGVTLDEVEGFEFQNAAPNRRRIVGVWNCQRVSASRLRGSVVTSFLATGGKDAAWAVPCRDVLVSQCHTGETTFGTASVSFGGNTELWRLSDSTVAGLDVGGNRGEVSDCTVLAPGPGSSALEQGRALRLREAHGADFTFAGVSFVATRNVGAAAALVELEDSGEYINTDGAFVFSGCRFELRGFTGVPFRASARNVGPDIDVEFLNCVGRGPASGSPFQFVQDVAGAGWKHVGFNGCDFKGSGVLAEAVEAVGLFATRIANPGANGVTVSGVAVSSFPEQTLVVSGCDITGAQGSGVFMDGTVGTPDTRLTVLSSRIVRNNGGGADTNVSVRGESLTFALVQGGTLGGAPQTRSLDMNDVASVIALDFVSLDDLPRNFTGATIDQVFGERFESQDAHHATGALMLGGATSALAGTGADDLVIGDGSGNRGLTVRSSAGGVSRVTFGDIGDPNRFRMQADHNAGVLDFLNGGGRDVRLYADAVELGKVYADDTDGAGAFVVNTWTGVPSNFQNVGGPFASAHFITQTVASKPAGSGSAGQVTFTFPEPYDEPPIVMLQGFGESGGSWELSTVQTNSCILTHDGALSIGDVTGFRLIVVGRRS